jgi:hypothetical protein
VPVRARIYAKATLTGNMGTDGLEPPKTSITNFLTSSGVIPGQDHMPPRENGKCGKKTSVRELRGPHR